MTKLARGRVVTELLGGSPLALAVQSRRLPADVQPWWPSTIDEWKDHVARVRRGARASWYEALRPAIMPRGAATKRLERAVAERGVVVTSGQQAGLFGGPLYTLTKALTTLGLADSLEEQLGIPVAPVFWAATDDADFLEASITYVADADGLHELELGGGARPPAGTPMSLVPLAGVTRLLEQLRKACGSAAHAAFFELARAAFTEDRTLGEGYVRFLRELLEPLGIAVLDASHSAYRDAARPLLNEALERATDIASATAARAAALRKAGFDPQVEDERGLSLVFAIENGVKRRLTVDEARNLGPNASRPPLAPNVLLRPLVERELLPTVAYVAGPAELAYFTQANAVAMTLERPPVVGVPRWSCTVIEPFVERALSRLGVEYHELRDRAALERRLAWAGLPAKVASAWEELQEQIRALVESLVDAVRDADLAPPEVPQGLGRSLQHKLSRGQRRLLAAAKRRAEDVRRDLDVASAALFPLGKRQERVLNYVPMLARGGDDLLDDMKAAARAHALSLLRVERAEPVAPPPVAAR